MIWLCLNPWVRTFGFPGWMAFAGIENGLFLLDLCEREAWEEKNKQHHYEAFYINRVIFSGGKFGKYDWKLKEWQTKSVQAQQHTDMPRNTLMCQKGDTEDCTVIKINCNNAGSSEKSSLQMFYQESASLVSNSWCKLRTVHREVQQQKHHYCLQLELLL